MKKPFTSNDNSVTAPALRRAVSDPLLTIIPESISPNALTLSGAAAAGACVLILWFCQDFLAVSSLAASMVMVVAAMLLVVYAVCDQLDGLQARRTRGGGARGDFLDHWVDALLANLVPAPLMLAIGYGFNQVLAMVLLVALAWWGNNRETCSRHERRLPVIGGLEFIWLGVVILLVSAFFGTDFLDVNLAGVSARDCLFLLVVCVFLLALVGNARRTPGMAREALMPLAGLLLPALWMSAMHQAAQLDTVAAGLGFLYIGFAGCLLAGEQIRRLWTGAPVNSTVGLIAVGGVVLLVAAVGQKISVPVDVSQDAIVKFLVLVAGLMTAWQGVATFRELAPGSDGGEHGHECER